MAPVGWPSAIAPPFGLTRSGAGPHSFCHASTTLAKASFTSNTSTSPMPSPVFASTRRVAGIGPFSIVIGSTPTSVV